MQASFAALSERGFSTRISEATSFCCLDHVRAAPASCRVVVMSALCNGLVHRTKLESSFLSASSRAFLRSAMPSWSRRLSSGSRKLCVVVATAATEIGTLPSLNDLPLINYISQTGRIQPPVEAKTAASIFAVYDKNKKIQYIGFSKDVRNSLRTLMGRRPELCHYYKLYNLPTLDQEKMLAVRKQWMSELGLSPPGNSDPVQRNQWEQPGDAGSISERGKSAAATSKAKSFLQIMKDRGLTEEMVYNPELLQTGKCDVLPSEEQSSEEIAEAEKTLAEAAARRKSIVVATPAGDEVAFEVFYENKIKTNGGWMYDILVSKDDKETRHRVVCGRIYPEAVNMPEDIFLERVFGFLLHKKVQRHTEGLLTEEFPINYFSVSEVSQRYDDFKDWFTAELPDSYWRFNKIHSYGAEKPPLLGPAFNALHES
ncbi:unnamed protein product [Sphagnum compactum]